MPRATDNDMAAWLRAACDDADRRGLAGLKPLLESLARSTAALRTADWTARELPSSALAQHVPASRHLSE
jgi:hypothetical protein